ncbi:chitosanase [Streptomyces sp. NPDC019937]|uniref:chitosanase n=1 Tax=Streptomyces sp. NPDC019937 TaxID=3154787 RepID=UPI0033E4EDD3
MSRRIGLTAAAVALPAALVFTGVGVGVGQAATPPAATPVQSPAHRAGAAANLDDPAKKEIAMKLVSSAENSSLDWRGQFKYIEDIGDGRGYTAGIIGFCSGTGDMLELVEYYTDQKPDNVLAKYLPALRKVNGSDSHSGLDPNFTKDWKKAAADKAFQDAQEHERDRVYFNPSVKQGKDDGLGALGQFIYYDAIVMHGPGDSKYSFGGIRKTAMSKAKTPAQGGNQTTYLNAFLDARKKAMQSEEAHSDTSRVDTAQRVFLNAKNFDLNPPLKWKVYGESFEINS